MPTPHTGGSPISSEATGSEVSRGSTPLSASINPFFPGFQRAANAPAGTNASGPARPSLKNLPKADVLITLAHPDDESFLSGTAALLQKKGYSVQFVYVTDGNAGRDVSGKGLQGDALGTQRRKETRNALQALDIQRKPLFLSFPDGMVWQNSTAIRTALDKAIAQTQPKLILSFGPDGITSHPDHVNVGRITDEAAQAAGKAGGVYHMGLSPSTLAEFNRSFAACPDDSWSRTQASTSRTAVKVNVSDVLAEKQNALRQHRSQFPQYDQESFKAFYAAHSYEEFSKG